MRKRLYAAVLAMALGGVALTSCFFFIFSHGVSGLLAQMVPAYLGIALVILLAGWWVAGRLVKSVIEPINRMDFDGSDIAYDELSPLALRIREQKARLNTQMTEIAKDKVLLDALSKSMKEGLLLVDRSGSMQSVNQSARAILDVSESCLGKNILEAIRHVNILERMNLALSGQYSELVYEISSRTYQILFSPVDNGALILLLDITEKAVAEQLRREFSANVSHELKTPLTIISGYAELMENGMAKSGDIIGMAAKIKHESSRLITLIEDIIRLSQLDESGMKMDFTEIDLAEVSREVAANLKLRADDALVAIGIPDQPMIVKANRDMIYEMLFNLVDNSIKYNKPGGKITVSLARKQGKTEITVADTGIGIEKKHLDRIFERFYRADPSRSRKTGGTGLGLSIVKHIVSLHSGTISVESKPGAGTAVHISF